MPPASRGRPPPRRRRARARPPGYGGRGSWREPQVIEGQVHLVAEGEVAGRVEDVVAAVRVVVAEGGQGDRDLSPAAPVDRHLVDEAIIVERNIERRLL